MDETEVIAKLNQLYEFQSDRDGIELEKNILLNTVKVPEEVQAVVEAGLKRMAEVDGSFETLRKSLRLTADAKLAKIVIPEEIKKQLEEIDCQRALINSALFEDQEKISATIHAQKEEIQAEVNAQTKAVYDEIARRKAEIEAEFAGKRGAVDQNIAALEKEIKEGVKEIGYTVESEHYYAIFTKAKKTWIPQRLEVYTEKHPDIKECYTLGDPSVALRRK